MPKQNQSETLSLPQLLQLAGIGGQPQQDTTREALGYMMGQQRLASEDADRKVRQLQAEQENAYRMKALDAQVNQKDNTAALHALGLLFANSTDPVERARLSAHIRSLTGMTEEPVAVNPETAKANNNVNTLSSSAAPAVMSNDPSVANRLGSLVKQVPRTILPVPTADGGYAPSFVDQFISQGILGNIKNFVQGATGNPSTPTATFAQLGDYLGNMLGETVFDQSTMDAVNRLPQNDGEMPPLTTTQLPPKTLAPDLYEKQYLVNQAQLATAEYLKRKAALRQAAGFQP